METAPLSRRYAMGDDEPTCVVCLGHILPAEEHRLEGCGHTFHNECIIRWLRRGGLSCPTCRADLYTDPASTEEAGYELSGLALRARASYLRAYSRRVRAPASLKRMVRRLRDAESKERELARQMREIRVANRQVFADFHRLRGRRWRARGGVRRIERALGMYACPETPLPALVVRRDASFS